MAKNIISYLIFLVTSLLLYLFVPEYFTFVFFILIIALVPAVLAINIIVAVFLRVKFNVITKVVPANKGAAIQIIFENKFIFPISNAVVYIKSKNRFSDEIYRQKIAAPILPNNQTIVRAEIVSEHCGNVEITLEKVKLYDLLGITFLFKKTKQCDVVAVTPTMHTILSNDAVGTVLDEETHSYSTTKSGDDISEVFDYHEYNKNDKYKNINWKISAKVNKLMAKDFSMPLANSVLILLELDIDEKKVDLNKVDISLETFISISWWLVERGISHNVAWFSAVDECEHNHVLHNEETIFVALDQIYNTKVTSANHMLQIYTHSKVECFSRILYIVNTLTDEMLDPLHNISRQTKLTVFFESNHNVPEHIISNLDSTSIEFVALNDSAIKTSIENFAI